jgi:hypothetical protein
LDGLGWGGLLGHLGEHENQHTIRLTACGTSGIDVNCRTWSEGAEMGLRHLETFRYIWIQGEIRSLGDEAENYPILSVLEHPLGEGMPPFFFDTPLLKDKTTNQCRALRDNGHSQSFVHNDMSFHHVGSEEDQ